MTEADAKTKWCPMSRSLFYNGDIVTSANRGEDGTTHKADKCLGSGCMAWRWLSAGVNPEGVPHGDQRQGFCGPAGKP